MSYKVTGTIKEVFAVQRGVSKTTGKEWVYQEFILAPDDNSSQYPKVLCFQLSGEEHIRRANLIAGTHVSLSFDISSRGYNGKYFTTLSAFGIVAKNATQEMPTAPTVAPNVPQATAETSIDNLPF